MTPATNKRRERLLGLLRFRTPKLPQITLFATCKAADSGFQLLIPS